MAKQKESIVYLVRCPRRRRKSKQDEEGFSLIIMEEALGYVG
jgi:hypothetical protein